MLGMQAKTVNKSGNFNNNAIRDVADVALIDDIDHLA